MQQAFDQRLADALANQLMMSPAKGAPTVEMQQESPATNDDSRMTDRSNGARMGTRKHPLAFGKTHQANYIRNQSEVSYENENSLNRH